jgi:hypothetical protein
MKKVTWTDRDGYKHCSLVRDEDPGDYPERGILQDPPNLDSLDWEGVKRDLHNALVDRGLYTWMDVQRREGLRGAILSAMKKRLISLYREEPSNG